MALMENVRRSDTASGLGPVAVRGRWRWRRLLIVVTGLFVAIAAFATHDFLQFTGSIATREPRSVARTDGIVVLTGGSQRIDDGLALLAEGRARRLLISGVNLKTSREEIGREVSGHKVMLTCCVDLGKSARNTIGNAIKARRWAKANGFRSLLIVTSNYHMPRTLAEFQHALSDIALVDYPVIADTVDVTRMWHDAATFRLIASEYSKFAVMRLRQVFEADPEHSRLPTLVGRQKPVGPHAIERALPAGG